MALAELTIGTETTRINLLNEAAGFHCRDWRPVAGDHAATFTESSVADLRQLVAYRNITVVESYELDLHAVTQDDAIAYSQALRAVLREALDYWATYYQTEPVYIAARASCETNTRYAIVYDGRLPEDGNPFDQPFTTRVAGFEGVVLVIERGPWLDTPPGTTTCLEISGQKYYAGQAESIFYPTAQTDDAFVDDTGPSITTNSTDLPIGTSGIGGVDSFGVRFRNCTIPAGATILSAFMRFESVADSPNDVLATIYGEDDGTPAAFSTVQDFWMRDRTGVTVRWPLLDDSIEPWLTGNSYDTPDITPIVQEIVDRADWASGNDMTMFVQWLERTSARYAASWDHVTADAPELHVTYVAVDTVYGRSDTCANEVYVANKSQIANITDIYTWDSVAGWSANLFGTMPYNLFRNPVVSGDFVIIGINTDLLDSGPFNSLVFDLSSTLTYAGASVVWLYYWTGVWGVLNANQQVNKTDNGSGPFSRLGVGGMCWEPQTDWIIGNLNTIYGGAAPNVDGYWIKLEATIPGGDSITGPATQQTRDIYTVAWPYIEIDDETAGGDIEALVELWMMDQASGRQYNYPDEGLHACRVLLGLRDVARGDSFTAYLNASDEQNPTGVSVLLGDSCAFATDAAFATGRYVVYSPAGVEALEPRVTWYFDVLIAHQFYGVYHAFLRGLQSGGTAGDFSLQLNLSVGTRIYQTQEVQFTNNSAEAVLDFGRIDFGSNLTGDTYVNSKLVVKISNTSGAPGDVYVRDLILIPADEWATETYLNYDEDKLSTRRLMLQYGKRLEMSSLDPKYPAYSVLHGDGEVIDTDAISRWESTKEGPYIRPGKTQRLWVFTMYYDDSDGWRSFPWPIYSVQAFRALRYLSMRGAS